MNRIKISPLATAAPSLDQRDSAPAHSLDHYEKLTNRSSNEFSIFVPMQYEKNYSYPLVVWLHSDGEDSAEIRRVMPKASMKNFIGIAPQSSMGNFEAGYYWEQDSESIDSAHDSIIAAIDYASMRFNVASNRIFIGGAGTGGTMAFRVALERPDVFAGVISINGPVPERQKPLSQWSECREIPVFWVHGRRSDEFSQDQLCQQLRLLHIAGFSVTLRQYPVADCLNDHILLDMNKWIMEMIETTVS